MAFATFAVNFQKSENRLQLTFILLLTTITFKFAVNQSLPRISYLTYLVSFLLRYFAYLQLGATKKKITQRNYFANANKKNNFERFKTTDATVLRKMCSSKWICKGGYRG